MALEAWHNGYGTYFAQLVIRPGESTGNLFREILASPLSIWMTPPLEGDYGPVGGGFLNPIAGASAICALLPVLQEGFARLKRIYALLFLFLLPGMLTRTPEFFRIVQAVPVLLVLAAIGLVTVAKTLPRPVRLVFLIGAVALSTLWDANRIFNVYPSLWASPGPRWTSNIKSIEQYRAFTFLESFRKIRGPGRLFLFLHPESADPSLYVATYGSNLIRNLPLSAEEKPHWAAVVCNVHYLPFLRKRFPSMTWIDLSDGLSRIDGGLMLAVLPEGALEGADLSRWEGAESASRESTRAFLKRRTGTGYESVLADLLGRYGSFEDDPFLESCFWEKVYYLYLQNSAFGNAPREENLRLALEAVIQAHEKGYPAAHYFNEEGALWEHFGKLGLARQAFERAVSAPLDRTPAKENLILLEDPGIPPKSRAKVSPR
jgi:hypothetical protein